ncbi:hypothetical protein [Spongiivirga citrea]|uniref:Uncharacterized protein n=1 Tax=Spongiivirga citrea TaxID=1481457 RepID=A0A6M0CGM9_9FLAO|nr:hypothetical protein [Spongiivirga citrea]NER17011.1 hypothetical protein [Spongiivirga citrea]
MKKVFLAVIAIVFNMLLFSCNPDSVAETTDLYENQTATGGEEGHGEEEEEENP